MTRTRILAVVSDLHCGSNVGLAHPKSKLSSGNEVSFGDNLIQRYLWENWDAASKWARGIIGKDPALMLVNGDATEGIHHRTTEVIASTIKEHTDIACACLRHFEHVVSEWRIVRGTECHTHDMESIIADYFGAPKPKDKLLMEMHGCLIDAAHHIGPTSRAYLEASGLSINMGNARLNYARSHQRIPQVFLRAHRHCGGFYSDGHGLIGVTGAWQFLTRHGKKVVTDSIPRPSILILDWREKKRGELPTVHEKVFNPPQEEIDAV